MALTARISLKLTADLTKALDLGTAHSPVNRSLIQKFVDGAALGQADRIFADTRTLVASATEDLDLAASLVDAFGATITMARLKALIVLPAAANTNNVNVSRPASNGAPIYLAASDGEAVHPGGMLVKVWPGATAIPVTPATGDLITFANSAGGTPVTYDVILIGSST
jgi:hypothetical protein